MELERDLTTLQAKLTTAEGTINDMRSRILAPEDIDTQTDSAVN
jgi:hypothetical protein